MLRMSYGRGGFVAELNSESKCAALGKRRHHLPRVGNAPEGSLEGLVDVGPVDGVLVLGLEVDGAIILPLRVVLFSDLAPRGERLDVKDPALPHLERLGRVHGHSDTPHGAFLQLHLDSGHGIVDPRAEARVARLAHGQVEGARGQEGRARVEAAVVEQRVQGEGEEGREGGEEGGGVGGWQGGAFGRDRRWRWR